MWVSPLGAYVVWRMHAGTAFHLPNRNPLLSGNVGPADYQYWIDHFGAVAGTGSGSTFAVPEPACAVACSLGIFGLPHRLSRKAKTGISCGRERTDGPLHKTLIPLNRR